MYPIYKKIVVIVVFMVMHAMILQAQQSIIIKDKQTQEPICDVNYQYGATSSQTDKTGKIEIQLLETKKLTISHIAYETLLLEYDEIKAALKNGWIALTPVDGLLLNPVTVYAVKGRAMQQNVKLNNGDWAQHDAGQVLQQIPGFSSIRKSGAFGFDPVFRGFKLDQLNILNDGMLTSTAACPNRMDPPTSQVPISLVQQIEVLKGPHSFRFGPSMGALINFKTSLPEFSQSIKTSGRLNTGFESNGEIYRSEGMLTVSNKKIQISANGSYSKGHHYTDGNDSTIPARFGRGSIGINTNILTKSNQILTIAVSRNFARNTDFPVLMMDLLSDDTWMFHGQYKITGNKTWYSQWNTQLFASFVDHKMGNLLRANYATMHAATDATSNTKGARTEFIITGKKAQLFIGADLKYETINGNRIREMITGTMAGKVFIDTIWQNSSIARTGIFGEWHQQLKQFKISISGRLDLVNAQAENTSFKFDKQYADNENTDVNGSISAGISSKISKRWQIGIWLGRGTRSANITERYINSLQIGMDPYEMLGNPNLKAESNNQTDLTISYKTNNASIQFNGYASIVSNYITSVINPNISPSFGAPGVRQFINVDKASILGFEFSWQQKWKSILQQQFSIAYTYGKNNKTNIPLPEIAPMDFRYRLEASLYNNKLIPFSQIRYVLKQERVANDFGEKTTPTFTTFDIGIKTTFSNFQITAAVNNLFNEAYREHLSRFIKPSLALNSTGRSLVIMATYNF